VVIPDWLVLHHNHLILNGVLELIANDFEGVALLLGFSTVRCTAIAIHTSADERGLQVLVMALYGPIQKVEDWTVSEFDLAILELGMRYFYVLH
jgi:hypothetical protein